MLSCRVHALLPTPASNPLWERAFLDSPRPLTLPGLAPDITDYAPPLGLRYPTPAPFIPRTAAAPLYPRWVREELHRWIFDNVRSKWTTVSAAGSFSLNFDATRSSFC